MRKQGSGGAKILTKIHGERGDGMSRLIDADEVKERLDMVCTPGGKWGKALLLIIEAVKDIVDHTPSVDQEQWIKFAEHPPELGVEVIVYRPKNRRRMIFDTYVEWYDEDANKWRKSWAYSSPDAVTAWRPKPEEYKAN